MGLVQVCEKCSLTECSRGATMAVKTVYISLLYFILQIAVIKQITPANVFSANPALQRLT